jgi:hypothetical protein
MQVCGVPTNGDLDSSEARKDRPIAHNLTVTSRIVESSPLLPVYHSQIE